MSEHKITFSREPIRNRRGSSRQRGVKFSPVLHILAPDGETTTFRSTVIAIPEEGADEQVWALLVTGTGKLWCSPEGRPVMVPVPPVMFKAAPETPMTWKQVAERAGVSLSSVRRAVDAGELEKPKKVGERAVRFDRAAVLDWIRQAQRG